MQWLRSKRSIFYFLVDILGINALFRFINRRAAIVLWYHGVCDDDFTLLKGYDERHIPRALFKKQLEFLKKTGHRFATMTEMTDLLTRKTVDGRVVVLTFDDGFRNIVQNAYPVMLELGARGCFYVVSGLIGQQKPLWTDHIEMVLRNLKETDFSFYFKGEVISYPIDRKDLLEKAMKDIKGKLRMLPDQERKEHLKQFDNRPALDVEEFYFSTWEQLRHLDRSVLEIGSHTKNHPNCENLSSEEEFKEELWGSKEEIEKHIGYEVTNFCYPAGSFNDEVIKQVKRYGYKSATTIIPGYNFFGDDLYRLKRISVEEDLLLFKALISGSYFFLSRLYRILKGA